MDAITRKTKKEELNTIEKMSLRQMWKSAGGNFEGPYWHIELEKGSMLVHKLLPFLKGLIDECYERGSESNKITPENITLYLDKLTDNERMEIFSKYCEGCGTILPPERCFCRHYN